MAACRWVAGGHAAAQKVYLERRNEVAWQVAELGILGTQLYL